MKSIHFLFTFLFIIVSSCVNQSASLEGRSPQQSGRISVKNPESPAKPELYVATYTRRAEQDGKTRRIVSLYPAYELQIEPALQENCLLIQSTNGVSNLVW